MSEETKSPDPEASPAEDAASDMPLPPPSFEFLTLSFKTQAEVHMGLLSFGEDTPKPNARLARHAIDLMAMLQQKTRGNLSIEEQRLLDNAVTELRFRYIQTFGAGTSGSTR